MMEGRTYLASDLAGELGLPRSTNDWLVRYADYLEVDTRGKRKVYSAKSLRILKEISEMRNEGKSSFEIEQLLASRYGIRPEVAPPAPQGPEQQPGASSETLPAPQEGGLPALRPAFEQMTVQINTEFLKLANRLEEALPETACAADVGGDRRSHCRARGAGTRSCAHHVSGVRADREEKP